MKNWITKSMVVLALSALAYGQAAPTAVSSPSTGTGGLSWVDGTIHYSLTASQMLQFGYYGAGNVTEATNFSGNAGYVSKSKNLPSSLLFSGGLMIGSQAGQRFTTYENVAVSQGLITGRWVFNVSDSFSYLPQSPTTGWSGIAGVGDIGSQPISGPAQGPAGGVLTYYGSRISNSLSGDIERRLTGATSVSGSGNWSVLHFLNNNNGLDSTQTTGQVGLNHRIDARNSVNLNAVYSAYDTTNNLRLSRYGNISFQTRGLNLQYQRLWTRALSMDASAGPQWITSADSAILPPKLNFSANIGFNYVRKLTSIGIRYNRGVNSGSGVQAGALADSILGSVGRPLGRTWMASVTGNYTRSAGLLVTTPTVNGIVINSNNGVTQTFYGGAQLTRGFGREWSGFVSYTAQKQSFNNAFAGQNEFNGLSHVLGIGITYAPKSTRLGEF